MELIGYTTGRSSLDSGRLDAIFAALSDPTRRAILSQLMTGEASVSEIAKPFAMSQPAVSKHLKVLEKADLITRDIDQQRRPARLKAETLVDAAVWLQAFWEGSFDQLDGVLLELQQQEGD